MRKNYVVFRVTEREHAKLKLLSEKLGIPKSEIARNGMNKLLTRLFRENVDLVEAK